MKEGETFPTYSEYDSLTAEIIDTVNSLKQQNIWSPFGIDLLLGDYSEEFDIIVNVQIKQKEE